MNHEKRAARAFLPQKNRMIEDSESSTPSFSEAPPADPMPSALRALALHLEAPPFASLSTGTARRLSSACNGFADLIQAGEDAPDAGMNLRSGALFLLSAMSALRADEGSLSLSERDEMWMIAEVESEFEVALALFEARTGQPHSPAPSPSPAALD